MVVAHCGQQYFGVHVGLIFQRLVNAHSNFGTVLAFQLLEKLRRNVGRILYHRQSPGRRRPYTAIVAFYMLQQQRDRVAVSVPERFQRRNPKLGRDIGAAKKRAEERLGLGKRALSEPG